MQPGDTPKPETPNQLSDDASGELKISRVITPNEPLANTQSNDPPDASNTDTRSLSVNEPSAETLAYPTEERKENDTPWASHDSSPEITPIVDNPPVISAMGVISGLES